MSFSPTYLGNFSIARPTWNTPTNKNKKSEHQHHFIQSAYNRVFFSLKSQHTIFVALFDVVQHFNSEGLEDGENGKDKEILSKFKRILNLILNSTYGNLFQINFAASDLIEKILNPSDQEQNNNAKPISTEIEKLGYKILSACLSIKRLISILSFTNYISAQLRYSQTEKNKDSNNYNNIDHTNSEDPELIEAEDDYQFDTFDSPERASSLGEKHAFPLLSKLQHHKRIHHSKDKNSNHNTKNEKNTNLKTDNTNQISSTIPHNPQNPHNVKKENNTNENQSQHTQSKPNQNDTMHSKPNRNSSDQISTQNTHKSNSSTNPNHEGNNDKTDGDKNIYDNCFHMVDDSTVIDSGSDLNEYYDYDDDDHDKPHYSDDEYYSDYYYYDYDDEYDKEPTVICRICEKEVPLSMIEEHSKSCVIAYESSQTMKSTDDHMKKLQAFAQQTVLHIEWPCNEEYAKTVVIPILHVVALLDRAISIDLNSSGAPEELDLICSCLNAITITKPQQVTPPLKKNNNSNSDENENDTKNSSTNNKALPSHSSNSGDGGITPVASTSIVDVLEDPPKNSVQFNMKTRHNTVIPSVSVKAAPLSASTTPTDKSKSSNSNTTTTNNNDDAVDAVGLDSGAYQDALSILSRARALVNEKSSAALSLSAAIDVFKQTTYMGMRGDLDDVSAFIRREVTIADFSFIRRISSGAYAKVYLTRKNQTGDLSATKVILRDSLRQKNDLQRVMVEKNILAEISNPFMIRFFFSIIGKNNLYLVMEYCPGGDLYSVLQNIGTFPEDKALIYTAEVVEALEFLRKKNVIHRDLKPDNILVAANGHLKLADFGMSAFGIFDRSVTNSDSNTKGATTTPTTSAQNSPESSTNTTNSNTNSNFNEVSSGIIGCNASSSGNNGNNNSSGGGGVSGSNDRRDSHDSIKNAFSSTVSLPGTPDYIAPEIILQQPHTFTADYWSLGCIIYELLTGIPPFHGDTPETTFANVVKGVYDESLLLSCDVSDEAIDLIRKLLTRDPKKRLGWKSIDEIKMHPWFREEGIDWNHLLDMEPPFVPQLANEEDTSYFEERYAMSKDDEKDIREDIEEAKLSLTNKSEKKTQSFFSDEKNLFSESSPTSNPVQLNDDKNVQNSKSSSIVTTPDSRLSHSPTDSSNNNNSNANINSKYLSPINSSGIKSVDMPTTDRYKMEGDQSKHASLSHQNNNNEDEERRHQHQQQQQHLHQQNQASLTTENSQQHQQHHNHQLADSLSSSSSSLAPSSSSSVSAAGPSQFAQRTSPLNHTTKGPMPQPSVTRTSSIMSSSSTTNVATGSRIRPSYHNNSDDDLSLFPSCSSGSLQTLTIEDSLKKFRKLQSEASISGSSQGQQQLQRVPPLDSFDSEFGSKIRVSRSSHNFHNMILNELKKDKNRQSSSHQNTPEDRHTRSQNADDKTPKTPNLLENGSPMAVSSGRSIRSKSRRNHVSKFHSSSNLSSYSNNYSENVYDEYSDETSQSPHFVESKSVSSLQKKWCMTPDGTKKKRRHSHRRTHRGNRKTSDESMYSDSSSNLISLLSNDDNDNDNIHHHHHVHSNSNNDIEVKLKDSALISDDYSNSFSNSPPMKNKNDNNDENKTKKQDYPLSKFVKSDLDDDEEEEDEDDQ